MQPSPGSRVAVFFALKSGISRPIPATSEYVLASYEVLPMQVTTPAAAGIRAQEPATTLPAQALAGKAASSASSASPQAQARASQNSAVLHSALSASISAGNEPLTLLYRSAIDHLNEVLKADLGENAIQNAMSQDNSPEATAGRIVSLSTGFFDAFRARYPDEDPTTVLENFMETIRSGFEQGFGEASNILEGLGVLEGDIASGIQRTYELVMEGYAAFAETHSAGADDDEASS